jgi:hypothetical protein
MLDQQHADPGFATVAGDSEWPAAALDKAMRVLGTRAHLTSAPLDDRFFAALRVGTDGFEGAPLTKHSVPAVKGTARGHALSASSPSCARPIVV